MIRVLLIAILAVKCGLAQTKFVHQRLDSNAFEKFENVDCALISPNGAYSCFSQSSRQFGSLLNIVSNNSSWSYSMEKASACSSKFTSDSRNLIVQSGSSLKIVKCGTAIITEFPAVSSFRLVGNKNWVAFKNDSTSELILFNAHNGISKRIQSVKNYLTSDKCSTIIVEQKQVSGEIALLYINVEDDKNVKLDPEGQILRYILSDDGKQVALFSVNKMGTKALVHYNAKGRRTVFLKDSLHFDNRILSLSQLDRFSKDGKYIFFKLFDSSCDLSHEKTSESVKVDVWRTSDNKLYPQQIMDAAEDLQRGASYSARLNIKTGDSKILAMPYENIKFDNYQKNEDYAFVYTQKGVVEEAYWNPQSKIDIALVNVEMGTREILNKNISVIDEVFSYHFSPDGKVAVYFDSSINGYWSYNTSSGIKRNLTKGVSAVWTGTHDRNGRGEPRNSHQPFGIAAWIGNDKVLIYERNAIWLFDLSGKSTAANLTGSHYVYRLPELDVKTLSDKENIIVVAFDEQSKDNGFYNLNFSAPIKFRKLLFGPYMYRWPYDGSGSFIKASKAFKYIFTRERASESPNYFYTEDFVHTKQLSHVHGERSYNWIQSELICWQSMDGTPLQGVLYKPQNFDSSIKYPIIFHFYETHSNDLHVFIPPLYSDGALNIPAFVSNGYLVFTPDIKYTLGYPGKSAFNSIVSAANYLSRKPWVNSNKMGLQGHSFGGYEVNYIISHTDIFAAAMSGAGVSDFMSSYNSVIGTGRSRQHFYEQTQSRMSTSPWDNPELYIENSPVFRADHITTPLLMMNNVHDGQVLFSQGVEFFLALRRLGKKAWMLQYENSGHLLSSQEECEDFSGRLFDFFNYYLKDGPVPKWMMGDEFPK